MTTDPRIAVLSALSSPDWHPIPEAHGMPWDEAEALLAAYDASRAVSSVGQAAHTTRGAEWRAAAVVVEAMNEGCGQAKPCASCDAREDAAAELRRMADETQQQTEPQCTCGGPISSTTLDSGITYEQHRRDCAVMTDSPAVAGEEPAGEVPCPGFPDGCPTLIAVVPTVGSTHGGGLRCGCYDEKSTP